MKRALNTTALHRAFLGALGEDVLRHTALSKKPLEADLRLPLPPRIRVYLYNLVNSSGKSRRDEHKIVLRVPGQRRGEYGSFDCSGNRLVLLVGYRGDLDVFVLWDAPLHKKFKWAGNIQVRSETVFGAMTGTITKQGRELKTGETETVLASPAYLLPRCLARRIDLSIMRMGQGS